MYLMGSKVYLARARVVLGSNVVVVMETIVVTVINVKTGVPGKFSLEPSSLPSLLARDEKDLIYGKNWAYWPEGSSCDPEIVWSMLSKDGQEKGPQFVEICRLYNRDVSCQMGQSDKLNLVDKSGVEFRLEECISLGDVEYCSRHDRWLCPGEEECLACVADIQGDRTGIYEPIDVWVV